MKSYNQKNNWVLNSVVVAFNYSKSNHFEFNIVQMFVPIILDRSR